MPMASRSWRIDRSDIADDHSVAGEVGDDADEAAALAQRADALDAPRGGRRGPDLRCRVGRRRRAGWRARWSRPRRGGDDPQIGPATNTAPSRFWLRAVRNPTVAAAARAICALVLCWVPKCMAADVSTTIHASRSRSAIWSRTCSSRVRAVTFQSMRRTSSPGWYTAIRPARCRGRGDALMLAVELAVEPAIDGELQRAQQLGDEPGRRTVRPFDRGRVGRWSQPPQPRATRSFGFGDTHIVGTVLSTRGACARSEMSRAIAS